jgi:hypothetical protein
LDRPPFVFIDKSRSIPLTTRVSFETSFDTKQTKLEPKLVSALSETKRLFWLFRFYTETESFGDSIEPKQTEEQPKQFDRELILVFPPENLGFFPVCFGLFQDSMFWLFRFFTETECFDVSIELKQTEDQLKQFDREHIWYFSENLGLFRFFRNSSVCFGCFDIGSKHRNKPKILVFDFTKKTKTQPKQILFWFVSVRIKIFVCLFRGQPAYNPPPHTYRQHASP